MAKAGTATKSRKSESKSVDSKRRSLWIRPGTLITFTFVIAVVSLAAVLHEIVPNLAEQPEYQFEMSDTRITPPHEWVPQSILSEVLDAADLPESVSLLDPDLCRNVAKAWEGHPWIRKVKSVQITSEPALRVNLEYRMPVAFVKVAQGVYPVDVDGVLLPPSDFSMSDTTRLPHISNIQTQPQAGTGKPWGDFIVASAARLAAVLAPKQDLTPYWTHFQLTSIVAPNPREKPTDPASLVFELETIGGNRVVWGKPPGADALEPTPDVKLARLEEYQSRFGSLDGVNGLHRIDIRLFDGITLQPLSNTLYR